MYCLLNKETTICHGIDDRVKSLIANENKTETKKEVNFSLISLLNITNQTNHLLNNWEDFNLSRQYMKGISKINL